MVCTAVQWFAVLLPKKEWVLVESDMFILWTWKEFSNKKPRLSGKTLHGCTQTLCYIIIIQTISVGPTKVDLNKHDIRLGRIYFHSTLLIRSFGLTAASWGTLGIRWPTICFLCRQDRCCFTPFSSINLTLA